MITYGQYDNLVVGIAACIALGVILYYLFLNGWESLKNRKSEEVPRALAPKVTPYYDGRVTVAIDFTNEKDAVLALLYPTATPKLQAAITIINALKKPHKIELVITTTEGKT